MKYLFNWNYASSLGGPWREDESVELDDALAEAIQRTSPGVLTPVVEGETRAAEAPPNDRMIKEPRSKRKHTVAREGEITADDFKAVKDK